MLCADPLMVHHFPHRRHVCSLQLFWVPLRQEFAGRSQIRQVLSHRFVFDCSPNTWIPNPSGNSVERKWRSTASKAYSLNAPWASWIAATSASSTSTSFPFGSTNFGAQMRVGIDHALARLGQGEGGWVAEFGSIRQGWLIPTDTHSGYFRPS